MLVPTILVEEWRSDPHWLAMLPQLVAECAVRWDLVLEEVVETPHSLVVLAGDAVLKLNAPSHHEAEHESDALELWDGVGAVRLLGRDDARRALLVERCRPGTRLSEGGTDALAVVLDLLPRLERRIDAGARIRNLAEEAERWEEETIRRYDAAAAPFERPLVDLALDVFRSADASTRRLVNVDLHGGNVLRAEREPWLVIDPKPLVGEAELDGVGLVRNAAWSPEPRREVRRWLDGLAGLGLDRERLRAWGVAHALAWGWDERHGWSGRHVAAARTIAGA